MILRRRPWVALAVVLALGLTAAACGDDSGSSPSATGTSGTTAASASSGATGKSSGAVTTTTTKATSAGAFNAQTAPAAVKGGTLTVGIFQETAGLDPAVSFGSGVAGASELAAIYDVLMRYDSATGKFEPRLAASLTSSTDATEWTLKLRPNVKFTDGTPLDASAVEFNLKRHVTKKSISAGRAGLITTYTKPDATTLVMKLSQPWAGFPYLLADLPGMIASPTAVQAMGDADFNKKPVGAGPFKVVSFFPGDKLTLERNDTYWNGAPNLDGIVFTRVGDGTATFDALKTGTIQQAVLREVGPGNDAKKGGYPGSVNMRQAGVDLAINSGIGGKKLPTSDVRVRKAIAMSIDPSVVNSRVYGGAGFTSTQLFQDSSRWFDGSSGPAFNTTEAKKLLDAVKQETAWDGTLHFVSNNTKAASDLALSVKTMLEATGFKIDLDNGFNSGTQTTKMLVDANFDIATWACNVDDAGAWVWLNQCAGSKSPQAFGYADTTMDGLLDQLRAATDEGAQKKAITAIAARYAETVPFVSIGALPETLTWAKNVYGLTISMNSIALYDKAFIAK